MGLGFRAFGLFALASLLVCSASVGAALAYPVTGVKISLPANPSAASHTVSVGPALGVGGAPYNLDAKGTCHSPDGKLVNRTLCAPGPKTCRDMKGEPHGHCRAIQGIENNYSSGSNQKAR
jgi:hypothetical protein